MTTNKLTLLVHPRLLAIAAALVCATLAWLAARHHLQARELALEARVAERHATVQVLVSSVDLHAGEMIDTSRLATRRIPARYLPSTAAVATDVERVAGQRVLHDVRSGEPLLWPLLAHPNGPAFSSALDTGRRALTFPVDEVNAVAGMLVPGDIIDLLYSDTRVTGRPTVRPLLQKVVVLATGSTTRSRTLTDALGRSREAQADFATITLSVSPEEAQLIVLAQRTGELTAVLRHPADASAAPARTVDVSALAPPSTTRRDVRAPVEYVQFITGGSRGIASGTKLALPDEGKPRPTGDVGDVHTRLGLADARRN